MRLHRLPARLRPIALALLFPPLALLLTIPFVSLESPPPSFLLYDRNGGFLAELGGDAERGNGYWPLAELPPRVVLATQALEDRRFWSHPGVDPLAVARALFQNLTTGRRVSGASTLAMQVARMQAPAERGYASKAREAWVALALTLRYGREAVLRQYLTLVPYGNQAHGIAYAARLYFDKPVADLSWAEIALLSAIPQAPTRMNPLRPQGLAMAVARGRQMLDTLRAQQVISPAEHDLARAQIGELRITESQHRPLEALHPILELGRRLALDRVGDRAGLTRRGQFILHTTLDLEMQRRVTGLLQQEVLAGEGRGIANGAVLVIEPEGGAVRAWVGSPDYFDNPRQGAMDFVRIPRSPGSTLKPFLFALALERGVITPATVLDDLPPGVQGIVNADRRYLGPLLPRQALANSRNVPAARLLQTVGIDEGYGFLRELGLHRGELPARHYGLGLSVGAMPVTLADLVRAYAAFDNDGRLPELRWYAEQETAPPARPFSAATARGINRFLSDPVSRLPSFPRDEATDYPFPVALKTGTSQGFRDAWTLAWSRRYLVGAWLGNARAAPMTEVTGGAGAAGLVHRVMFALHPGQSTGLADLAFPPPEGYRAVRLCAPSGLLATEACGQVFEEWLAPETMPTDYDGSYRQVAMDLRTGQIAQGDTPPQFVERRTVLELPARYAEWAVGMGGALPRGGAEAGGSGEAPQLRILAPEEGTRLVRDPEAPAGRSSLALRLVVEPPVEQVLWVVDGEPFQLAEPPYTARWPIALGEHRIQALVPYTQARSRVVQFRVE